MMNELTHNRDEEIRKIREVWANDRFEGIERPYSPEDVYRLRGSLQIEYTIAKFGAQKLWQLLNEEPYVPALGALTGNQALQMVQGGLKAIYASGWQVAADANTSGQMYPDQSLYPSNSVPQLVKRINQAFQRVDQIQHALGDGGIDWFVPIVADAEAGFGGPLNVFEITKAMIEAGASGIHFEDQLSSEKKCGHLGGKVLVPTSHFIRSLVAARLASDVMGTSTLIIARTDANGASLITSDIDPRDQKFLFGKERTPEGFLKIQPGLETAISRGIAAAPYADLIWCETSKPDLEEAERFADAVHKVYPRKMLAYNCSPSFHWERNLDGEIIRDFQKELANMGYKFQFVTLAGFHALNYSMFELASEYSTQGMPAYVKLQRKEFEAAKEGYSAIKHQRFVGTEYFDDVSQVISSRASSTTAMLGSTERAQFAEEDEKESIQTLNPAERTSREA